ncbi:MAG: hypothetical protein H0V35_15335 [Nitrospira sp.]|nr:hypothetical protein [Nitrospira sp.]
MSAYTITIAQAWRTAEVFPPCPTLRQIAGTKPPSSTAWTCRHFRTRTATASAISPASHPWFQAARHDRHSRYRRYYIWTDAPPPADPNQRTIFPDEEKTVWTYDDLAGQYYYHQFYHFEPDLDVTRAEVREEIKRVIDFWLSFGISGFRVDAVSHMIESPHTIDDPSMAHDPHQILR